MNSNQNSDPSSILEAAQAYFRILHESDAVAAERLFHPDCHLFHRDGDQISSVALTDYLQVLRERKAPKDAGYPLRGQVLAVDMTGAYTALLKVNAWVGKRCFTDYLSLVRDERGWRIVTKVYRPMPETPLCGD